MLKAALGVTGRAGVNGCALHGSGKDSGAELAWPPTIHWPSISQRRRGTDTWDFLFKYAFHNWVLCLLVSVMWLQVSGSLWVYKSRAFDWLHWVKPVPCHRPRWLKSLMNWPFVSPYISTFRNVPGCQCCSPSGLRIFNILCQLFPCHLVPPAKSCQALVYFLFSHSFVSMEHMPWCFLKLWSQVWFWHWQ